jgi:hypothetical protein
MKTHGEPDPLYIAARSVLLDALEALGPQRDATVLVGAQAIYRHTGAVELEVAEYTTDADVVIDPRLLTDSPQLESALRSAGFVRGSRVGAWVAGTTVGGDLVNVEVDLMVPEAFGGPGRRAARLVGHGDRVARKARGLEAALVDQRTMTIAALDNADRRSFEMAVAGPGALLISKLHKIRERVAERDRRRVDDKDALDVWRLLQAIPTDVLAGTLDELLHHPIATEVTREAVAALESLFSQPRSPGAEMAARAAGELAALDQVAQSVAFLTTDLLKALAPEH